MIASVALALALQGGLPDRVAAAPDGEVRLSYATRPGVCGNGRNTISLDCEDGWCGRHRISVGRNDDDDAGCPCTRLRVYVGGAWRAAGAGVTDLGTVSAAAAARYLLDLAARAAGDAGHDAVFPAVLADSVTVWPDLLRLARSAAVARETRRSAVFWLGQAAGEAATRGLTELLDDTTVALEVKESAVFALSQQPRDQGVPALIRVARTHPSPGVRKKALFWLGQSDDPRALALFEEILTKGR